MKAQEKSADYLVSTQATEWLRGTLGELLPIKYGKSLPEKLRDTTGSHPVFGSSGLVGAHSSALTSGPTLIIGRKGNVGAIHYSGEACWPIDTVYYVEPPEGQNLRYYKYLLESLNLVKLDKSTAVPGLSRDDYNAVEVVVAPPDQQDSIVEEIEKQFSRLDMAVENLKRVKANLKRYKAAVLKAAVEGRLVETEAESTSFGKQNWKPIGLAIGTLDQGWSPQCESEPTETDETWAVMKTTAVQPLRFMDEENKRLPPTLNPRTNLELVAGDLLITRAGPRSRVGVTCLVKTTRPHLMLCDKAYRLRVKPDMALPGFLEIVLNSPDVLYVLDELKTGISDSGLNLTQKRFKELLVPLPPLVEQKRIVAEVDRRLSLIREKEAQVDANLQRAERLRQSILAKAFAGLLVQESSRTKYAVSAIGG